MMRLPFFAPLVLALASHACSSAVVFPNDGSASAPSDAPASASGGDNLQATASCDTAPVLSLGMHVTTTSCGGTQSTGDSICQAFHPHVYYRVEAVAGSGASTATVHTTEGVWINEQPSCGSTVQSCTVTNSLRVPLPSLVRLEWSSQTCGAFDVSIDP